MSSVWISMLIVAATMVGAPNMTTSAQIPPPPPQAPADLDGSPLPSTSRGNANRSDHSASDGVSEYRIGSGDLLDVTVYPGDDLKGEFRINAKGEILLPLVGKIKITGMTLVEANERIEIKLRDGFYRDPQVIVSMKEYHSQRVSVLGAVNSPGAIVLIQPTRLLGVLSDAGGIKETASDRLVLVRSGNVTTSTDVVTIGLSQLLDQGDLRENVWVYPGDMVYVPHGGQVYLLGALEKPGAYAYQDGMTVLKAISGASGLKPTAASGRVNLIRRRNGQETHQSIDFSDILDNEAPDVKLMPEDILVVPEGFF